MKTKDLGWTKYNKSYDEAGLVGRYYLVKIEDDSDIYFHGGRRALWFYQKGVKL